MTDDAHEELGVPGVSEARQIGSGAFGRVYRARQDSLDRIVAVKVLANVELDEETTRRFDREGKAIGRLSGHPNIVDVYSQGATEDNKPYLMMEFCPGGSYGDRIRREGSLTWREATEVAITTAGALETAHRAGILHRDIKPDNILIDDYDMPRLADFGIARMSKSADLTATGTLTGSPAHMPPELVAGKPANAASDVYSLASTLFTLIAGRPAFVRDTDESIVPLLQRISFEPAPRLEEWGVPRPIADVVARALSKEPAERPGTCEVFGNELNQARIASGIEQVPMKIHGDRPVDPEATRNVTMAPLESSGDLAPAQYSGPASSGPAHTGAHPQWPVPSPTSGPSAPSAGSLHGAPAPWSAPPTFAAPTPVPQQSQPGPMPMPQGQFGPMQPAHLAPDTASIAGQSSPTGQSSFTGGPVSHGRSRRPLIISLAAAAFVVVLIVALVATLGGKEEPTADHGATGLLVDGRSVPGDWVPKNTTKMDIVETPCGTVSSPYSRIEEQGYVENGRSIPRWSSLGATATSESAAQQGFSEWSEAFGDCTGADAPDDVAEVPLPDLPCDCADTAAFTYREGGVETHVGLVRKGDALAGVQLQSSVGAATQQSADVFQDLMTEAAKRAEAVG